MTIGMIKQREHAYEPEAVRLRASRGNRRTNDYISFILDCLAKPFYRDMCNFKIYIMIKGLNDRSARSLGTRMPTGSGAAVRKGQRHDYEEALPKLDHT